VIVVEVLFFVVVEVVEAVVLVTDMAVDLVVYVDVVVNLIVVFEVLVSLVVVLRGFVLVRFVTVLDLVVKEVVLGFNDVVSKTVVVI